MREKKKKDTKVSISRLLDDLLKIKKTKKSYTIYNTLYIIHRLLYAQTVKKKKI